MKLHNTIVHNVQQGSDEWEALRIGMITASKFADIIKNGKGKEESKCKISLIENLTVERLINRKLDIIQTFAMKQGLEREETAKLQYKFKTLRQIQECGLIQIENTFIACSPDGLIDQDGGLEIKCPEPKAHYEYLNCDSIPDRHIAQVQGCMWVTNRFWWDFVSYNPDFPEHLQLKIIRVNRDDEIIEKIKVNAYDVEEKIKQNINKFQNYNI